MISFEISRSGWPVFCIRSWWSSKPQCLPHWGFTERLVNTANDYLLKAMANWWSSYSNLIRIHSNSFLKHSSEYQLGAVISNHWLPKTRLHTVVQLKASLFTRCSVTLDDDSLRLKKEPVILNEWFVQKLLQSKNCCFNLKFKWCRRRAMANSRSVLRQKHSSLSYYDTLLVRSLRCELSHYCAQLVSCESNKC